MTEYKATQCDRVIDIVRQMGLVENTTNNLHPKQGGRMRFTKPNGSVSVTVTLTVTMVYRHVKNGKIEVARFANKDVSRKALTQAFRIKPEHKDGEGVIEANKAKIAHVVSVLEANGFVYAKELKNTPLSNGRVRLLTPKMYVLSGSPLSVVVSANLVKLYQHQLDDSYVLLEKLRTDNLARAYLETILSKWMPR